MGIEQFFSNLKPEFVETLCLVGILVFVLVVFPLLIVFSVKKASNEGVKGKSEDENIEDKEEDTVKAERCEYKNFAKKSYHNLKIGTSLGDCVKLFSEDFCIEQEYIENGKVVVVLVWYIFAYIESANSYRNLSSNNKNNVVKRSFIRLTFKDNMLVKKEQEGLYFDIV